MLTAAADTFDVPVDAIIADEVRFQTRRTFGADGVSGQLLDLERFGREAAGILSLWRDPATGMLYVVDGHNRLDLARRCGEASVRAQLLNEPTAEAARLRGALINMQARNFTAFDVASVMRETGWTQNDLEARGVSLRDRETRDGADLARLHPALFAQACRGDLSQKRAALIGRLLVDEADQLAVAELLEQPKHANLNEAEVEQLVRYAQASGTATETQVGLFGATAITRNLAVERARLTAAIRERLANDKRLFRYVADTRRAERLAEEGSRIDRPRADRVAGEASGLLELFDRLANRCGPLADLLRGGAEQIAAGAAVGDVAAALYDGVRDALSSPTTAPAAPASRVCTGRERTQQARRGERTKVNRDAFRRYRGAGQVERVDDLTPEQTGAVLEAARADGALPDMVMALLTCRLRPDTRRHLETLPLE